MRFARHRALSPAPDMTPMVDVVFLLLIFFLTTTQMAQSARSAVDLPEEEGEEGDLVARSALVVNIDASGSYIVMDDARSPSELNSLAREAAYLNPGAIPIIRADRRAPASRLNFVVETLRDAGFTAVRLATAPEGR
ncbi:MAG: biopolymer transporter ExbD [Planctomycetota bacterium]|nr:biopolymer transporter ExbD [Planctomycetota bacterium]